MFSAALVTLLAAAPALAHFHLNYPPPRGPFVDTMELNFCSSYPTGARSPFPLDGGFVDITSEHPSAVVLIEISFDQNPTTFVQFNTTDNGTTYPPLVPTFTMNYEGELCVPVDSEVVGIPILNGTNATIQVFFNGGDGQLYDCADVVLITNYTVPSNVTCSNSTTPSTPASNSTSTNSSSSSGSSGSSPAVRIEPASAFKAMGVLAAVSFALVLSV